MTADQATTLLDPGAADAPPQFTGPQVITNELIDAVANGHCGWSKRQLQLLGVGWPPPSGWRQRLVAEGRALTGQEVEDLYAARKKKGTAEDGALGEISVLPCPWCSRPVQRVEQGGHLKEFCSKRHKNLYNAALNKLSIAYARTIRTPGSLQIWAAARVDPSLGGGNGLEAPTGASGGTERQGSPSAPASPDVT